MLREFLRIDPERFSLDAMEARYAGNSVPLEHSLDKIYRPRPAVNDGAYYRNVVEFTQAAGKLRASEFEPYGCYISSLDIDALGSDVFDVVPRDPMTKGGELPRVGLFLGGPGSGTHWHYDPTDNFILVLSGIKRIRLVPPGHLTGHHWTTRCANFHSGDDGNVRPAQELELRPGDGLYLPAGWWHSVENERTCAALSYFYRPAAAVGMRWSIGRLRLSQWWRYRRRPAGAAEKPAPTRPARDPEDSMFKGICEMDARAATDNDLPALVVAGQTLGISILLQEARRLMRLDFMEAVATARIVRKLAEERGLTVDDDLLQSASDELRAAQGLFTGEETHRWLAARHMSVDDLEYYLETAVLADGVRASISAADIHRYFDGLRDQFAVAILRSIVVTEEPLARELAAIVEEGAESFETIARKYSAERADQLAAGRVMAFFRCDLPIDFADEVFSSEAGRIFERRAVDGGWAVQRLEEIQEPRLDRQTERLVREKIFQAMIKREGFYWTSEFADEIGA